ncbi:hypothetical protein OE88DRAFT_1655839 [Heliocybe sulcata]|uniref:Uncharacterized protein n=1 Tax=Heliocybe sulcata TaxID=5364 RepID=A0A5C3N978_9AGAM|nr:hypothetical protein OE88DRAFT_1655839 [Heliocybe sulcata]
MRSRKLYQESPYPGVEIPIPAPWIVDVPAAHCPWLRKLFLLLPARMLHLDIRPPFDLLDAGLPHDQATATRSGAVSRPRPTAEISLQQRNVRCLERHHHSNWPPVTTLSQDDDLHDSGMAEGSCVLTWTCQTYTRFTCFWPASSDGTCRKGGL